MSRVVWIQSIHGRRFMASTGPFAPKTMTGTRSQYASKIAIDACIKPTLLCTIASIGLSVTFAYPWAIATAASSCRHSSICGFSLPE